MKTNIQRSTFNAQRPIKLWPFAAGAMTVLVLLLFTGCNLIGADTTAPSAVERQLFVTKTNFVDVPVQVQVTNYVTKEVVLNQTNTVGQIVTVTNVVEQPVYSIQTVTNHIPQYENTVSDRTKASVTSAGGILNYFFPGMGGMISSGALALLGAWAHLRSGKRQQTAVALSQEVESIREFIKTLPSGAKYDTAITSFLQSHQMETGVSQQVLNLLENEIDYPQAKAAIEEIKGTLNAANSTSAA